jgi:hypothetical protein
VDQQLAGEICLCTSLGVTDRGGCTFESSKYRHGQASPGLSEVAAAREQMGMMLPLGAMLAPARTARKLSVKRSPLNMPFRAYR